MVRSANERSPAFYAGCTLWVAFSCWLIAQDLGVLAFVGSVLLAVYFLGLRDKFSNESTASAYSVFNKDGQGIVGGFTGEQLDRQLRGGIRQGDTGQQNSAVAVALTASKQNNTATNQQTADERLRRRQAAAAAAERRTAAMQQGS